MAPTGPEVRRARMSEQAQATKVLSEAFGDDPIMSWMIGADRDVADRLSHLFGRMLGATLGNDAHLVDIVGAGHAVAFWNEVDTWKPSASESLKMVPTVIKTFGRRLPRAMQAMAAIENVHPDEPHRYLAFIGVHPDHQGQGHGGALLASMVDECDERGLGAYLESSNPRNDALYARYGFESRGPIALPAGAPVMTAMWRNPR